MPKLIVFGPTGQTGIQIIRQAVENPENEVSIFIRTPSRLPEDLRDKVNSIQGDVTDQKAVIDAIRGQDAVLSSLGTGKNVKVQTLISTGVKNIVAGMREHNVKKLVFIGIAYLLDGYTGAWLWKCILGNVTDDHERVLQFLRKEATDIGWIGIMPPQIVDNPHTGNYATAVEKLAGSEKAMSGDMAHAMLSLACDDNKYAENNHKLLGISSLGETSSTKYDCNIL